MLAGRLSLEAGNDPGQREKYAWELLDATPKQEYDNAERRFILDFASRILRVDAPEASRELKEAFNVETVSLREAVREIEIEEAVEEKAFDVARTLLARQIPINVIVEATGLDEDDILALG